MKTIIWSLTVLLLALGLNAQAADSLLTLNKPASATSQYTPDYKPSVAVNGDYADNVNTYYTWWASGTSDTNASLDIDLGKAYVINQVKVYLGKPIPMDPPSGLTTVNHHFKILGLRNGVWKELANITGNADRIRTIPIASIEAEKIRYQCMEPGFCRLREIEAYGSVINSLPLANAGADQSITLPVSTLVLNGSGNDSDGTIASYAWTKVSGGAATLAGAATQSLSLSGLAAGTYVFQLTVVDNLGAQANDQVSVVVKPAPASSEVLVSLNKPASATSQYTPDYLPSVAVNGDLAESTSAYYTWWASGNNDDARELTVDLQGLGVLSRVVVYLGKPIPLDLPNGLATVAHHFSVSVQRNGVWTLVSEISGNVDRMREIKLASVQAEKVKFACLEAGYCRLREISVYSLGPVTPVTVPNVAPMANAGADQTITLPTNSVVLNGSGTDSDGTIASYAWSKISGGAVTLANAATKSLSISGLVAGTYVFQLAVVDSSGAQAIDQVSVIVNPAPTGNPTYPDGKDTDFASTHYLSAIDGKFIDSRLWRPDNRVAGKKYPLFVFFHGAGESVWSPTQPTWNQNNLAKYNGTSIVGGFMHEGATFVSGVNRAKNPMYIMVPQIGMYGQQDNSRVIMEAIDALVLDEQIDPDRIYIGGLSQGGGVTTQMMFDHYPKLAAAVPMSAWFSGNPNDIGYQDLAVWIFHAADDGTVAVGGGDAVFSAMIKKGGHPIYSRMATGGHGSTVWRAPFNSPIFMDWMMKQRRGQKPVNSPVDCKITSPTFVNGVYNEVGLDVVTVSGTATVDPLYTTSPQVGAPAWITDAVNSPTLGSIANLGSGTGTNIFSAAIPVRWYGNTISVFCTGSSLSSGGGKTLYTADLPKFVINHH